jgi:2'-5' RNA ligase
MTRQTLDDLYARIHTQGIRLLAEGRIPGDPYLEADRGTGDNVRPDDRRRGLALLIPLVPSEALRALLDDWRGRFPEWYVYPDRDLHVTVVSLISARDGYAPGEEEVRQYQDCVRAALEPIPPFTIAFEGIIASPTGLLLKGYYEQGLDTMRTRIRAEAARRGLPLLERYETLSAHVSLARYIRPETDREKVESLVQEYENHAFGEYPVQDLVLVHHDWYNHASRLLARLSLIPTKGDE